MSELPNIPFVRLADFYRRFWWWIRAWWWIGCIGVPHPHNPRSRELH